MKPPNLFLILCFKDIISTTFVVLAINVFVLLSKWAPNIWHFSTTNEVVAYIHLFLKWNGSLSSVCRQIDLGLQIYLIASNSIKLMMQNKKHHVQEKYHKWHWLDCLAFYYIIFFGYYIYTPQNLYIHLKNYFFIICLRITLLIYYITIFIFHLRSNSYLDVDHFFFFYFPNKVRIISILHYIYFYYQVLKILTHSIIIKYLMSLNIFINVKRFKIIELKREKKFNFKVNNQRNQW